MLTIEKLEKRGLVVIDEFKNLLGQNVKFWQSDDECNFIYASIGKLVINTDFFEMNDMEDADSDYIPVVIDGEIGLRFQMMKY